MFVGEAPGFHEDQKGEPFVGAAGQLLNDLLESAGLSRADIYIANVIKCRPPNNRDPEPQEVETCKPFLLQQIAMIRPKLVCSSDKSRSRSRQLPCKIRASPVRLVQSAIPSSSCLCPSRPRCRTLRHPARAWPLRSDR
jgi:uracil-DNA glycosylase family 4